MTPTTKKELPAKGKKWLRLDNSAKIYPMLISKKSQNLFRISTYVYSAVDPILLQTALSKTLGRFPSFNVRLVKGFFWYYFEEQVVDVQVYPETDLILDKITYKSCNGFLFRISYFEKRISAEFFHAIADGSGAIEFLKCLLYEYFLLQNLNVSSEQKVLTCDSPITANEIEDSFLAYYRPAKLKELQVDGLKGKPAFAIKGVAFSCGKGLINASLDSSGLIALAKAKGCSLTEYLSAVFMYSIYKTKAKSSLLDESMQLYIPINLRNIFPSKTLRNFTLFSRVQASVSKPDLDLDYFIEATKTALKQDTQKELLRKKITTTVKAEKILIMRILPLPIKHLIFKISTLFFSKNKKTCTFSNIGKISLPETFKPFIDRMVFSLNANDATPVNMAVGSTFGRTVISFTRAIQDCEIEEYFVRFLTSQQLSITIESNFWERDRNEM